MSWSAKCVLTACARTATQLDPGCTSGCCTTCSTRPTCAVFTRLAGEAPVARTNLARELRQMRARCYRGAPLSHSTLKSDFLALDNSQKIRSKLARRWPLHCKLENQALVGTPRVKPGAVSGSAQHFSLSACASIRLCLLSCLVGRVCALESASQQFLVSAPGVIRSSIVFSVDTSATHPYCFSTISKSFTWAQPRSREPSSVQNPPPGAVHSPLRSFLFSSPQPISASQAHGG